jgi:hypothetical protein
MGRNILVKSQVPVISMIRKSGLLFLLGATALCELAVTPADAQISTDTPPPIQQLTDDRGVDLTSGQLHHSGGVISIGDAATGLFFTYFVTSVAGMEGTPFGSISSKDSYNWIVTLGTHSARYQGVLGVTPLVASGFNDPAESLVVSGNTLTYTLRDGTVAVYVNGGTGVTGGPTGFTTPVGIGLVSLTYPNGRRLDYTYNSTGLILSVVSNAGYQMKFLYGSPTRVVLLNMAVDYCDPAAASCTFSQSWPTVTISGGGATPFSASDSLGRATTFSASTFQSPGGRVFSYTFGGDQYNYCPWIHTVTDAGNTWTYNYSVSGEVQQSPGICPDNGTITTTAVDPLGHSRTIVRNNYQLVSYTDELSRQTQYQWTYTFPAKITYPEGNYLSYTYDANGNRTQVREVAKPGSGITDIVASASYDPTCTNPKTCHQPNYTIDGRGSRVDFTYDPAHGGVLTQTLPADRNGVRPQKRYTYAQLYAYVKNPAGALVPAANPVWVRTQVAECRTTASCTGGSDEVVTTYEYAATGTANRLLFRGKVETSQGVSLRTCYGYDVVGNQISVTTPRAGLSACP